MRCLARLGVIVAGVAALSGCSLASRREAAREDTEAVEAAEDAAGGLEPSDLEGIRAAREAARRASYASDPEQEPDVAEPLARDAGAAERAQARLDVAAGLDPAARSAASAARRDVLAARFPDLAPAEACGQTEREAWSGARAAGLDPADAAALAARRRARRARAAAPPDEAALRGEDAALRALVERDEARLATLDADLARARPDGGPFGPLAATPSERGERRADLQAGLLPGEVQLAAAEREDLWRRGGPRGVDQAEAVEACAERAAVVRATLVEVRREHEAALAEAEARRAQEEREKAERGLLRRMFDAVASDFMADFERANPGYAALARDLSSAATSATEGLRAARAWLRAHQTKAAAPTTPREQRAAWALGSLSRAAIAPDGLVVAGTGTGIVRARADAGGAVGPFAPVHPLPGSFLAAACSDDGRHLLVGGVRLLDGPTRALRHLDLTAGTLRTLDPSGAVPTAVAFLPGRAEALVARLDGSLELWDVAQGTRLKARPGAHGAAILALAVGGAGADLRAVTGDADGRATVWDVARWAPIATAEELGWITSVAVTTAGEALVAGTLLALWRPTAPEVLRWRHPREGCFLGCAAAAEGKVIVSLDEETATLWELDPSDGGLIPRRKVPQATAATPTVRFDPGRQRALVVRQAGEQWPTVSALDRP